MGCSRSCKRSYHPIRATPGDPLVSPSVRSSSVRSPSVRGVAALAVCTFAFAAGCFGKTTSAPAATVNGTTITTKELVDELNAINANPAYIKSLQTAAPGSTALKVTGTTSGSFDAGFVSQTLLRQVLFAMVHAEVAKRHLAADDACRLEASNDAIANLGNGDSTSGQPLFDKFPKPYQTLLVNRNVDVLLLESALSGQQCGKGPDAEAYYNSHQADFTRTCLSIIGVSDQTTADSVVAQLKAGADFATLAKQLSLDTTSAPNGGDIGCKLPSEIGNPQVSALFAAAKVGDVLDPIQGQTGYTVVKVTDRQLATLDEVRSQAEELASTSTGQAFSAWLQDAKSKATVTIDRRYGTFDPSRFQISPPSVDNNSAPPSSDTSTSSIPTQSSSTDAP